MKRKAKILHNIYKSIVKILLNINYDFCVWKEESYPEGPKIFCSNHFSSSDVHFVSTLSHDPLHIVIGPGFSIKYVKNFLSWTEQIPALTYEDKKAVVQNAVKYLKNGDNVYIFPEGRLNTQEDLDIFRAGIARIYLAYPVPIIPIGLIAPKRRVRDKHSSAAKRKVTVVNKNYYANIGKALYFKEEEEIAKTDPKLAENMILDKLRKKISFLIDDVKTNKFWS
ncbi:1-acyl-sn-glycerol-3-phosphate acyltransferase [bacterium]|nr:1-acyl-sn-glycerol-3-phosphate acyltransferase [bacterium]